MSFISMIWMVIIKSVAESWMIRESDTQINEWHWHWVADWVLATQWLTDSLTKSVLLFISFDTIDQCCSNEGPHQAPTTIWCGPRNIVPMYSIYMSNNHRWSIIRGENGVPVLSCVYIFSHIRPANKYQCQCHLYVYVHPYDMPKKRNQYWAWGWPATPFYILNLADLKK